MIGDSWEADIEGSYQSKIDQLWFNPERLPAHGFIPTFNVCSLSEIQDLL